MSRRFVLVVLLLCSVPAFAAEPFIPAGLVKLPSEATIGPMSAVAIDQQDRLYVLHRGTPPLLAFDADGNYLRGWGADLFKVPHGLRIDADGHVWTTDNGNHVLRKFDREGKLLATLGTPGKAGGGKDGFRSPDDVVFDTAGNLFVADAGNGRIVKLSPSGEFLLEWGKKGKASGQFATTHGLAIDKQDRIYVADRGNKRVQVFDSAGKHLADWSGFGNPFGLLMVGDELLATEGDIHRVFHLGPDGKIVTEWGDPKMLLLPHFMAVNSQGVLFVAEVNGKRVQMFRRP
ncbi:MAG: peptidyl-alpha-hydroxyglycine alpha-amidating lyase family protein [Pirellulaceae bacterium]|nr:peptidyl-alpha-hydroxyglycine alpha-amidating lyase family protein [Pirellulaceae bacterium]